MVGVRFSFFMGHDVPLAGRFVSLLFSLLDFFFFHLAQEDGPQDSTRTGWAQCDSCLKWRRIPWHVDPNSLPEVWYCKDNSWDPEAANCDVSGSRHLDDASDVVLF